MKIFLSYSRFDSEKALQIKEVLKNRGHEIFYTETELKAGDNWINSISRIFQDADIILVIISRFTIETKEEYRIIESLMINDIPRKEKRIIPVSLDGTLIPGYLSNYYCIDLSIDFKEKLNALVDFLSDKSSKKELVPEKGSNFSTDNLKRNTKFISFLTKALKDGKLTLVCGAGVSIEAKIPAWNDLLLRLLGTMLNKISDNNGEVPTNISTNEIHKRLGSSSLILGKYLKSNLGNDFSESLRKALYQDNPKTCKLIKSIVELCRPQRDGKLLDSIITFNFDSLIEENLYENNIKHKAIFNECVRNESAELPIYHVHGYLPRNEHDIKSEDVVFSEDTYHTQFLEPFSWSNLIQLNKLGQNTCLFVGISLSDPNLRRLLDVAKRKESGQSLNHFIIKKVPNVSDKTQEIDRLMMFLEEQDANELGLNVIWVNQFDEISNVLESIISK